MSSRLSVQQAKCPGVLVNILNATIPNIVPFIKCRVLKTIQPSNSAVPVYWNFVKLSYSQWYDMVARKSQPSSESCLSSESKTLFWILTVFPRNRRYFPQLTRKLLYINSLLESDHIFWKRTSSPKVERHLHYTNALFRMLTQTAVQKPLFHCANVISCKLT